MTRLTASPWTVPNLDGDFSAWHHGRPAFAFWGIELGGDVLDARIHAVRASLGDSLRPGYRRQAHLTIGICGFPTRKQRFPDDFLPDHLDRQISHLQAAAPGPFEIAIGGLGSFASAAYLVAESRPAGALTAIRKCLSAVIPEPQDFRFTPHVTVGLYGKRRPMAEIDAVIRGFGDPPPITLPIRNLALMTYDPTDLEGPLGVAGSYDLERRRYDAVSGASAGKVIATSHLV